MARRKFKRPRHKMKPVFDRKGRPSSEKPLNHGVLAHLDPHTPKVGPLDLNTEAHSVHHNKVEHPKDQNYLLSYYGRGGFRIEHSHRVFEGKPAGAYEMDKKLSTHYRLADAPYIYKKIINSDTKKVYVWCLPKERQYIVVEVDVLVRFRRESCIYTSAQTAELMFRMQKTSWESLETFTETSS